MKAYLSIIVISLLLISCKAEPLEKSVTYSLNLNDRSDDTFKVTLLVNGLTEQNNLFQFAATAPGTYQTMDMGRYVTTFKAYDTHGNSVQTTQQSINQYTFSEPEKVAKVEYTILETWDTPVDSNSIYKMCGTSIEDDHVMINGQGVFGYFKGMQSHPIRVKLNYPKGWLVGSALPLVDGYYEAKTYDHIVDSPILLGRLTKATTHVEGVPVDIYTYSATDKIKSAQILSSMEEMLKSASKFVYGLPVDRYTFLFHFEGDRSSGAWEHSYSSSYAYKEAEWETLAEDLTATAAHEFFHVVTPLNIHSEIIQSFNFTKPVPSQHLWLYEGTTEWASHMMLFRGGIITLDDYLEMLSDKIRIDGFFNPEYSIKDLALKSYSKEGQKQYGNIYYRGALVAGLLDIRLLELSEGKRGLREVVRELAQEYGANKPFNEATFIDEFATRTYPEIRTFFKEYIENANPLPYKLYYEKIGITFSEKKESPSEASFGLGIQGTSEGKLVIYQVEENANSFGFKPGDLIKTWNGTELTFANVRSVFDEIRSKPVGTAYTAVVVRYGKEVEIQANTVVKTLKNVFELSESVTEKQRALRNAWMKRL